MKLSHLKILFILGALSFIASCGGDNDEDESLAEYYIQFKMNGELHTFQVKEPGYQACGSCACASVPPLAASSADIEVCTHESDDVNANDIESLDGSAIVFSGEDFPNAHFSFTINGVDYSTYNATSQTGSSFIVTEVSEDGEFGIAGGTNFQMFKVKGTFSCTVRADDDDTDIAITEGKFAVRFSEN